jgi:hypothetical protein
MTRFTEESKSRRSGLCLRIAEKSALIPRITYISK